jgi:broad specificity phosphatase PhoE
MKARVLLVRHPPVAKAWAGRCYGRSDMAWSRVGMKMAGELAERLAAEPLAMIVHSGAIRTRRLAEMIGKRSGVSVRSDPRWQERDFGAWEGRSWNAIWRETGSLMDRMITDPAGFRPGGGETGVELMHRVQAAWDDLDATGDTLIVAHGGSIAAIRAHAAGHAPERMIEFVPQHGALVTLDG